MNTKFHSLAVGSILLLVTLIFNSCDTSMGIFYALEREVPISDTEKGLPKNTSVKKISYLENGSSPLWVIQGASRLFYGKVPEIASTNSQASNPVKKFEEFASPTGTNEVISMATSGDELYGVFRSSTLGNGKLYHKSTFSSTWSLVDAAGDSTNGFYPWDLLEVSTDQVLVISRKEGSTPSYLVQLVEGGVIGISFTGLASNAHPRAIKALGSNYYLFTHKGKIYTIPVADISTGTWTERSVGTARTWISAAVTPDNRLVGVSWEGYLIASTDGTTWIQSDRVIKTGETPAQFTSILYSNTDLHSSNRLLAGTANDGLYVVSFDGSGKPVAAKLSREYGNYSSATDMVEGRIVAMGGARNASERIFVGTELQGLWSAYYDENADGNLTKNEGLVWSHE